MFLPKNAAKMFQQGFQHPVESLKTLYSWDLQGLYPDKTGGSAEQIVNSCRKDFRQCFFNSLSKSSALPADATVSCRNTAFSVIAASSARRQTARMWKSLSMMWKIRSFPSGVPHRCLWNDFLIYHPQIRLFHKDS